MINHHLRALAQILEDDAGIDFLFLNFVVINHHNYQLSLNKSYFVALARQRFTIWQAVFRITQSH